MVLAQLLLLCLLSLSSTSSSQSSPTNCPNSNVYIPYPFKINSTANATPGFLISCNQASPVISLGDGVNFSVLNISLPEGYVRVTGKTVYSSRCHGNNSQKILDLRGTNYMFSNTQNKFTVVGCDAMAMIRNNSDGADGSNNSTVSRYSSGCVSFCASEGSIVNGECSGVGCCQSTVPKGLDMLDLEFTSIRNQLMPSSTTGNSSNSTWCSKAFVAEQNSYKFSRDDLHGDLGKLPMVLEWYIQGRCDKNNSHTFLPNYMCKDNSVCYEVEGVIGYRCNCSEGFDGNPYIGCKGGSVGLLVVLLVLGFWTYWIVKKRRLAKQKQRHFLQNGGLLLQQQIFTYQAPARIFTASELEDATNNFSEDRIVGRGGYGTVYKGILSDQTIVAIKKSKLVDQSQMEQFINELIVLSQIDHKNVVKILGCCLETEVPLLVYEFISNGALFHHLHNTNLVPISWEHRLRIAAETASALANLHLARKVPIIHRDVKSANILIDENYTAKVSDFGASRLVPSNQTHVTTLVQGTLGYLDPEYFYTSQLTDKSDVYSFGVVLVELLTRQKPISYHRQEEGINLASHFTSLAEQNRLQEIVDSIVVKEAGMRHVNVVSQLILKCLKLKGEERPGMVEVAIELEALRRLMKQHLSLKSEKALRELMEQQSGADCKDLQLLQEESSQEEIRNIEPLNLYHGNNPLDKCMESSPLLSMDLPW
uniref:Protein kinase domain-containing protein n=1 Tax=Leersia perrieri TaxID=77586 RepID=A0A0D9W8X9_9ORYZ